MFFILDCVGESLVFSFLELKDWNSSWRFQLLGGRGGTRQGFPGSYCACLSACLPSFPAARVLNLLGGGVAGKSTPPTGASFCVRYPPRLVRHKSSSQFPSELFFLEPCRPIKPLFYLSPPQLPSLMPVRETSVSND